MVKEEIVTGLKNAVARGESLEKAMASMTSAGYSAEEVREASGYVSMGASVSIGAVEAGQGAEAIAGQAIKSENKKGRKKAWLVAILILVLVLIIGGVIASIFFGEEILGFLFPPEF